MYKLLIADDDEIICRGLGSCILWEQHGVSVSGLAYDGEMALEMVEIEQPDIIIADINMPFMDGMEFSCMVRQKYPEIKIILLTAYKEFSYAKQAIQLQIFEYLTKPFTNEEILQTVLRAVKTLEKERSYRSKIGKNLGIIQEKNLEELVLYGGAEEDIIRNSPILQADHYFQVAILYLRRISEMMGEEKEDPIENEVVRRMAVGRLREYISGEKNCSFFEQNRRIVVVFEYEEREESRKIEERILEFMDELGKEDHVFLACGAGRVCHGVEALPVSYGEASQAIEQRYGYGNRSIIFYSELRTGARETEPELSLIKKQLQEGIQLRDENKIREEIGSLFQQLGKKKEKNYASECFRLMELLRFSWEMTEDEAQYDIFMKQSGHVLAKMMEARNLAELEETAAGYFSRLYEYLRRQSTTDIERRVNQAVEYIRENYPDPELSLEEVAKAVSLSSSYLGNCIKKYKHISYVNLLNQIRLENAKRLLVKPDIKTYEVAFLVGYNSSQYFSSSFKKSTGMTPGAFRDCMLKNRKLEP